MMRKFAVVFAVLAATAFWVPQVYSAFAPKSNSDFALFSGVLSLVRTDFVEERTASQLIRAAIGGMLHSLDPYSQFLDADAYQDLKNANEGRFGGIGLEFSLKEGDLTVITPLDGTPAERAGLLPGDHILQIDGKPTRDMSLADASRALRGEPGTRLTLSVLRDDMQKTVFDVSMERAKVRVPGVRAFKMLEPGIAYARVSSFQKDTAAELRKALDQLKMEGARFLILDLRNNPGGPLDSAIETAELFIPSGKTIVTTRGRSPSKNTTRISRSAKTLSFDALYVLVNKGSASDSEILAGALKDHGLAKLVGTKTYGKGSIQSVIPVGGNSAVRLTTSRYFTPSGAIIHEKGIEPDFRVEEVKGGLDAPLAKAVELLRLSNEKKI